MFTLEMMRFDSSGWHEMRRNADGILWAVETDLLVEYGLFPVTDYQHDLRDPELFRTDMANMLLESGGALIDFEVFEINSIRAFKIISKGWLNQDTQDLRKIYTGTISFPLAEGCFQLKVMGLEQNPTGVRESVVALSQIAQGKLSLPHANTAPATSDKTLAQNLKQQQMVRAPGDGAEYDERFPSHPLTRVRMTLRHIQESLIFDPILRKAKPYYVQIS